MKKDNKVKRIRRLKMKEKFVAFMINQRLSEHTRLHYINVLTSRIKTFAKKYLPDYVSIFDLKIEDAVGLINQLENDLEFSEYYKKSNNIPSSAFHKYLEFIDSLEKSKDDNLVGAIEASESDDAPPCNEKISVWVNRYERDVKERKKCIAEKGLCCYVCGMNFEDVYGEIGRDFIHVHHIKPLADNGQDISENLIPVCPNCHAMLHRYLKNDSRDYIALKNDIAKLKR